jgi:hypothetical protein
MRKRLLVFWAVACVLTSDAARAQTCPEWVIGATVGPPGQYSTAMAYDSIRGVTVLLSSYDAAVWEWDGTNWTMRDAKGPAPRNNPAMTFDSTRGVVVLFGGRGSGSGQLLGGTWEWDGDVWAFRGTSGPPPQENHRMAFDSVNSRTVLVSTDWSVWNWDGVMWTSSISIGLQPGEELLDDLAFDSETGNLLLLTSFFFSFGSPIEFHSTLREFDGTSWTIVNQGPVPGRAGARLAFHAGIGLPVAYGGGGYFVTVPPLTSTWAWSGAGWDLVRESGPAARSGHAMVYDAARDEIVMFGGSLSTGGTDQGTYLLREQQPISRHPQSMVKAEGEPAILSVSVAAMDSVEYQWRKDGAILTESPRVIGTTMPAMGFFPILPEDAGSYDVVVPRSCGSISSQPAMLTVSGQSGCGLDVDHDGSVGFSDITEILAAWGFGCP